MYRSVSTSRTLLADSGFGLSAERCKEECYCCRKKEEGQYGEADFRKYLLLGVRR